MRRTSTDLATLVVSVAVALAALLSLSRSLVRAPVVRQVGSAEEAAHEDVGADQQKDEDAVAAGQEGGGAGQEAGAGAQEEAARELFVSTWAERIDAFNAGYPLEGYGRSFAAAAYDYGVDPRYSPAIARVESGSGRSCSYPNNAWGWGSASWPDWDTAIRAHVSGLAASYGYTLTWDGAVSYNELSPDEWYGQVESCMHQIWGSDGL